MSVLVAEHAAVDPRAELADDVEIGPFCVVGPQVRIGRGTRLLSHVTLLGQVDIGCGNVLYPQVVIGGDPQDLSFRGGETRVEIGDHNTIRESATIHRASVKDSGVTKIGSHNYLMAGCHVAHDCRLGSHIVIANATLLGGHVRIEDCASISGGVGVHHYVTIGCYSFVGGMSRVLHDIPPFMLADGQPARPRCINVVALRRAHLHRDVIDALHEAHRLLYRSRVGLEKARETLAARGPLGPELEHLFDFVQTQQQGRHGRGLEYRRSA